MIIGKWNKSVILTYVGLIFSVIGMYLSLQEKINYALICLIVSGICDLFDGYVARKCKRTEEEKQFGIELDSLVDIVSFGAFPVIFLLSLGYNSWYHIPFYCLYMVCQVARLAYFNISLDETNKNKPVKHYQGLPVTFTAIILPATYLLSYVVNENIFKPAYFIILPILACLNVLNIKVPKPKGLAYPFFLLIGIIATVIYIVTA